MASLEFCICQLLFHIVICFLTLNVPVPYKYGTNQCVEPRFHALEPHLSRTSRAFPIRVPRTRAAVRRRPRNSHSHASRISTNLQVILMQLWAAAPRISMQLEAVGRRISMTLQATHSHAFPRNNKRGSVFYHEITNSRFKCCHGEL